MSEILRIGLLGAGANTRTKHIPGLRKQEAVTIVAACNRSLESTRRVCAEFDIPRPCATPWEILDDPQIDAVVIGTWPSNHCEYTVAALERGKHVLCEARMAMNSAEAERMIAVARQRPHLVAQIVPSPFSMKLDDAMRAIVRDRIGAVRSVRMELIVADDGVQLPPRTWRRDRSISGNNIMGVGIWYEAMIRWVGPLSRLHATLAIHRPVGVDPQTGTPVTIDVPDHVEAVGELAWGGTFSLTATSVSALPPGNRVYVAGAGGSLFYDHERAIFTPAGGQGEPVTPDPNKGWRCEAEFINAIRGRERIRLTDFDTGLVYMRFTDALHESHRLGCAVRAS
ncbi:MAG: Gfo/Idh/MocA family oxidoreductase [Phycisphaeraceae bacterium]|nr:Gfo/Idh/MocA family oxidoreductase [Phycisphaeraceae bacterium]